MNTELNIHERTLLRMYINEHNFTEDSGEGKDKQIEALERTSLPKETVERYKANRGMLLLPTNWPVLTNNPTFAMFARIHMTAVTMLPWYTIESAQELQKRFQDVYLIVADAEDIGVLDHDPCYNFLRVVSGKIVRHPGVKVEPCPFKRFEIFERDVDRLRDLIEDAWAKFGTRLSFYDLSMYNHSNWGFRVGALTIVANPWNGKDGGYCLVAQSGFQVTTDRTVEDDGVVLAEQRVHQAWDVPYSQGIVKVTCIDGDYHFLVPNGGTRVVTKELIEADEEAQTSIDEFVMIAWMLSKTA